SFTGGREQTQACRIPSTEAASPAQMTPNHGPSELPTAGQYCCVRYDTPNPAIAPMTSVPSWPRLIRPLFSVSVSPRLTKMNGVLTRMAPPSIASGTPQAPIEGSAIQHLLSLEKPHAAVERLEREDHDEENS